MQNNNRCLPPNCTHQPLQAILTLSFESLILSQTSKPTIAKLQFWGQKQFQYLQLSSSVSYNIHTTNKKFTDYLRDMQGIKLLFLDSRNNEEFGYAYINFLMYLRKDYEIKDGPFFVNEFQITGDILNNKKKKVGQCGLKLQYKIVPKRQQDIKKEFDRFAYDRSVFDSPNLLQNKFISNNLSGDIEGQQKKMTSSQNFNALASNVMSKNQSQLSEHLKDFPYEFPIKKHENYENPQLLQELHKKMDLRNFPKSNYELQIMQLKLQADQLLQKKLKNQQVKTYHIQVYSYTAKNKQNKRKSPTDLCLGITIYKSPEIKKHIKIYPINQQGKFQSAILAELDNLLQIIVIKDGKQQGIGKIQVKKIINAKSKQLDIFKRQICIGSVKLIHRRSAKTNQTEKEQQELDQIKQSQFKDHLPQKIIKKKSEETIQQHIQPDLLKPNPYQQKFMLITINNSLSAFSHSKFLMVILNQTTKWQSTMRKKSTLIINLRQTKTLLIQVFTQNKNIGRQIVPLHQYMKIPIIANNLKCMLVFDEWIQVGQAKVSLSMQLGTMKQINKTFNSFEEYAHLQTQEKISKKQQKAKLVTQNLSKSQQNYSQRYQEYIMKDQPFQPKKHYTQSNPRVDTNPISEFNRQSKNFHEDGKKSEVQSSERKPTSQVSHNQQFFLVDLLSKGLHLTDLQTLKKKLQLLRHSNKEIQQFKKIWVSSINKSSDNQERKEDNQALVQILIDMFLNEQQNMVDIEELLKCLQSYHNFVDLWWSYRQETLSSLQSFQPNIKQKIKNKSVLGVIKYSILFDTVLVNLPNQIKRSFEKYYHISTNSPLYIDNLFEDLQALNTGTKRIPIESTPSLVEDLSRIIKQTLQQLIEIQDDFKLDYQQVNLRTIGLIMQELGIKISLWEGLLLIEELKNYYNTDTDLPQGVISAKILLQWLKSLSKKSKKQITPIKEAEQQMMEIIPSKKQQPFYKSPKQSNMKQLQNNNIQNYKFGSKNSSSHFQNNESDVFQIANLLRENDQMQMRTISMTNNIQKQNQGKQSNHQKFPNMQILQDLSKSQLSQSISSRVKQIKKHEPMWKYVQFEIKEVKLKQDPQNQFFQVLIKCENNNTKTVYIKNLPDLQGKSLWQKIDFKASSHSTQGFSITFSKRESEDILFHGILPIDDVLLVNNTKQKTLVLYGESRNIVGKVSVIVRVFDKLPEISKKQKKQRNQVQVVINYIEPSMQVRICSMQQVLIESCTIKQKHKIEIKGQLYQQKIIIEDDEGLLECIIPLQQLFFKKCISGQYPIINTLNGQFVGQLYLTITNLQSQQIEELHHSQITNPKQQIRTQSIFNKNKNANKFYLFLDQIYSYNYETSIHHSFIGSLYIKKPIHNEIIFKSTQIQHDVDYQALSITNIKETYLQININQNLLITFEYQGKCIAEGQLRLEEQNLKGRAILALKTGVKNLVFRVSFRVIEIINTNYSLTRILKSISQPNISYVKNLPKTVTMPDLLNEMKSFNKLTLTEIQLLQQILQINKSQNILDATDYHIDFNNQLLEQFLFRDRDKKGFLLRKQFQDITKLLKVDLNFNNKQPVDYIDIIRRMKSNSIELIRTQQAFKDIDSLHASISKKYGNMI